MISLLAITRNNLFSEPSPIMGTSISANFGGGLVAQAILAEDGNPILAEDGNPILSE